MRKTFLAILAIIAVLSISVPIYIVNADSTSPRVATPAFNPPSGTFPNTISVVISCPTSGATIHFTSDGTQPTFNSPIYTGQTIEVAHNVTFKAKAFMEGLQSSETATAEYKITTIIAKVATPVFSLSSGTYPSPQTVTVSCKTPGATIHISFSSQANAKSQVYNGPIYLSSSCTLSARAYKDGMGESNLAQASYVIASTLPISEPTSTPIPEQTAKPTPTLTAQRVLTPQCSLASGTYSIPQTVVITCQTEGATIYYTTNGAIPTQTSLMYTGPITVSSSETLKAKAFKEGMTSSETYSATFTITQQVQQARVVKPSFNMSSATYSGTQILKISCATEGALIYYTTDGSIPTASSLQYSGPITIDGSVTLTAKAFKTGISESESNKVTITITQG